MARLFFGALLMLIASIPLAQEMRSDCSFYDTGGNEIAPARMTAQQQRQSLACFRERDTDREFNALSNTKSQSSLEVAKVREDRSVPHNIGYALGVLFAFVMIFMGARAILRLFSLAIHRQSSNDADEKDFQRYMRIQGAKRKR
ncbi:hypothetical protein G3N59_10620 [Paraburkholderia sp. Ac-20340]|uniref:hypothetical protein n=1 Tax=Paraburkholderia sp. Ac-20340 TaxID=2703888 RepID=UPI00197E8261|nr:hypothetical protein [Paraburkholderia sp. Ac-20340]MBN3853832.1 hypothetical protein [Paraburkholderia sp. Ac-20340]